MIDGWKMKLSLCMITKNNEKHLPDCLLNTKDIADEIVIIDLGSTDQTVAIAEKAGANVYHKRWNEDNSEVKNACLELAQGRWVLFLQANETITREQMEKLPTLLNNPNAEGYLLYIDQYSKKNQITSPVQSLRLFRNRKEYRYRYKIFERIPEETLPNIKDAGIRIMQHTDQPLLKDIELKNKQLKDEVAEHPDSSYLHYIYGMELLNEKRYEEGAAFLERARQKVKESDLFAPHLFKCLSWSLISLERYQEALTVLERAIQLFPAYTDFFVLRGELFKQDRQYEKAIRDLEQCLEIKKHPSASLPKPEIHISVVLETLAEIHEVKGNEQTALTYYQQAYELNRTNQKLLYRIGERTEAHTTGLLEDMMKTAVEENNLAQIMPLIDIYLQQHKYTQVLVYLDKVGSHLGSKEQVASIKFFCYMMLGKIKEAEAHFSMINKTHPVYDHILLQRIESAWLYNDWQQAAQRLKEMQQRERIDQHLKDLYHFLQRLLTGKVKSGSEKLLTQREYEIISILVENLLWKEQEKKAHCLLPLLLQGQQEKDQYIKWGRLWAEKNDFHTIKIIFQCLQDKHDELEFKQKIIQHLLRNDDLLTANKINNLGEANSLGALDYVLWSRGFMSKLEKCIEKEQQCNSQAELSSFKANEKPSQALLALYQNLVMKDRHLNEPTIEGENKDQTCAAIHLNIGESFEKRQKYKEAFTAYLRSLQWDPQNETTHKKIIHLFQSNQAECHALLARKPWPLEGPIFRQKAEVSNYILGLLSFKEKQFEKAQVYFSKIENDNILFPIVRPYILSCLWISGNEEEVKQQTSERSKTSPVVLAFFRICQRYVLDQLAEGLQKYRNHELIKEEQEKVGKHTC